MPQPGAYFEIPFASLRLSVFALISGRLWIAERADPPADTSAEAIVNRNLAQLRLLAATETPRVEKPLNAAW